MRRQLDCRKRLARWLSATREIPGGALDKEPTLVLVKPVSEDVAESNLLVTTVKGRHLSFLLRSEGASARPPVDFVVNYRPAGSFLVEESAKGTAEIIRERKSSYDAAGRGLGPTPNKVLRPARMEIDRTIEPPARDGLAMLLERQQRAKLRRSMGCERRRRTGKETRQDWNLPRLSIKAVK